MVQPLLRLWYVWSCELCLLIEVEASPPSSCKQTNKQAHIHTRIHTILLLVRVLATPCSSASWLSVGRLEAHRSAHGIALSLCYSHQ